MSLPIIVTIVFLFGLGAGIWFGFMLGFSKAMREAAAKMQTTRSPVLGWGATGVGTVMLFIALGTGLYNWHFIRVARTATGIVTEMRTSQGHDGNDLTYAPVFRFTDDSGQGHTVASTLYQSPPAFQVGDSVPVLYVPANPQSARINTFGQIWFIPIFLGIFGTIWVLIGQIVLRWPQIRAWFREEAGAT